MGGLSGYDKTKSMAAFPSYFDSSRSKGGGRGSQSWGTPYSSMSYGNVTMDPSVRTMQDQIVSNLDNLYSNVGTQGQTLMNQYTGNNSAYMQAQIDPMLQAYAQQGGALAQNQGLRGISGSSFGDQALTNFSTDTQRSLADQRANAMNTQTGEQAGLLGQITGMQSSLSGQKDAIAAERYQQELAALGLGTNQQALMMGNWEQFQNRAMQNRQYIASDILGGFGMSKGGGSGTQSSGSAGNITQGSGSGFDSNGNWGFNTQNFGGFGSMNSPSSGYSGVANNYGYNTGYYNQFQNPNNNNWWQNPYSSFGGG